MFSIIIVIILIVLLIVIFWQISTLISIYGGIAYVSSSYKVLRTAFKLAKLKKGERFYELGSGIGNGLLVASREFGAKAKGIEISPFHWLISRIKTRKDKNIKVILADYRKIKLSKADVIYCYLSPKLMEELLAKLKKESKKGTRVLSYAFDIPGLKPNTIQEIDGKKMYLYRL